MISDLLIVELKKRFPDRFFAKSAPPDPVATFSAAHAEVGELRIYDDGGEARVEIGRITHGHFGCWDESLTEVERERDIVDDVVDFIEPVFDNKVIFFSFIAGRGGGWQMLKPDGSRHEKSSFKKYFMWSGPLPD